MKKQISKLHLNNLKFFVFQVTHFAQISKIIISVFSQILQISEKETIFKMNWMMKNKEFKKK